jgi:hypothetical protein
MRGRIAQVECCGQRSPVVPRYCMRQRNENLMIRVTPGERQMALDLAAIDGVSLSDAVRMAVRREHARRERSPQSSTRRR